VFNDELVLNAHMRSNDAFKAAFMNMYAFTDLQRLVAERLSEKLGRPIRVGQYAHIADSFHIYGAYFDEFEGFLRTLGKRTFEERTYRTEDVQDIIDEAREQIAKSLEAEAASGRKGL
jgi:thymidylate synthase